MKPELARYAGMKICVAVSGGRDSMALLHYIYTHGKEFGIELCALNCEHGLRGQSSVSDSAFVKNWCKERGIFLFSYEADCALIASQKGISVETAGREWRRECYFKAFEVCAFQQNFAVATAHHADDNAETVLFNICRGSSVAGLCGIGDGVIEKDGKCLKLIRPMIGCTRAEIDAYVARNDVPFTDDETNFSDEYTRNYIRINVIPQLEKCVHGAVGGISRLSRLASEDEQFFDGVISARKLINVTAYGVEIMRCDERAVFRRAAVKALKALDVSVKDYTCEHLQALYSLQYMPAGKKFEFLSFTAFSENGKIAICLNGLLAADGEISLEKALSAGSWAGVKLEVFDNPLPDGVKPADENGLKILIMDKTKLPETAVLRYRREGDVFEKFGGGKKSLGDYLTDKKIPLRVRNLIPVIADGNKILAVCGVEIAESVKVNPACKQVLRVVCFDFTCLIN